MFSCLSALNKLVIRSPIQNSRLLHVSVINPAARKGTREKARKKRVKVEVKKVGFIPHNQRGLDKLKLSKINKHIDDSWKAIPTDNVYVGRYYRWRVYSVQEAIECHRETHHPTMYNVQNAPLNVDIELNMQAEKNTRFVDNFQKMAMIPYKFDHGAERKIICFAKGQDILKSATDAGAILAGGIELIKDIQNGDLLISDYNYVVAHPNILADLAVVRGLMKRKFPNPKNGTLGTNVAEIVEKYNNGIEYSAKKDENQQDFGVISTCIGTIDMDSNYLESNLKSLLEDVDAMRPKRAGKFITRVLLKCPPSGEQFKIDPFIYVPEEAQKTSKAETTSNLEETEDKDDDEEKIVKTAKN